MDEEEAVDFELAVSLIDMGRTWCDPEMHAGRIYVTHGHVFAKDEASILSMRRTMEQCLEDFYSACLFI